MKYNDEAILTAEQFSLIAREYNSKIKVGMLVINDRALLDEAMVLASTLFKCGEQLNLGHIYNPRHKEFYEGLKRTNRLLAEFYQGEFSEPFSRLYSPINCNNKDPLYKIKNNLSELIKKLIRVNLKLQTKKDILNNIIDMYIELFNII